MSTDDLLDVGPADKVVQPRLIRLRVIARVTGLVTPFPLDVAADAGPLIVAHRLAGEHGVEGRSQVLAGDRDRVAGPAAVQLAPIDELLILVENVEIRRASGLVGEGNLLCLVVEVRECVADLGLFPGHHLGAVVGMGGHVVGADANNGHALALIFLAQPGQLVAHVLDVGAVVANERDQEGRGPFEILERHGLAVGVGKPESQVQWCRAEASSRVSMPWIFSIFCEGSGSRENPDPYRRVTWLSGYLSRLSIQSSHIGCSLGLESG